MNVGLVVAAIHIEFLIANGDLVFVLQQQCGPISSR